MLSHVWSIRRSLSTTFPRRRLAITSNQILASVQGGQCAVDAFLATNKHALTSGNCAYLLYAASQFKDISLQKHLPTLATRIKHNKSNENFNYANALYGLKNMQSESVEVRSLVSSITCAMMQSKRPMTAASMGKCFFGLRGMQNNQSELTNLLEVLLVKTKNVTDILRAKEVSNALYGLQSMRSEDRLVLELLRTITAKVRECKEHLTAQGIGNALYGLQGMSSTSTEVTELLEALLPIVANCSEVMSGQAVSNALYGMQRMSSEDHVVRRMIKTLIPKIENCHEVFTSLQCSNMFYGLRNFNSNHDEVRELVITLAGKLCECTDSFDPPAIGAMLYGLNQCSSQEKEVALAIHAIEVKLLTCLGAFQNQTIGNCFYGLRRCNSKQTEVRSLLNLLSHRLEIMSDSLTGYSISNILYGLQGMNTNHKEVRKVLGVFTNMLRKSKASLTSHQLCSGLYGLQEMNCNHTVVRSLISTLIPIFNRSNYEHLTAQGIGMAMYGLNQFKSSCLEVRDLLEIAAKMIECCRERLSGRAIGNALYGMKNMDSNHREVRKILSLLSTSIDSCTDNSITGRSFGNAFCAFQYFRSNHFEVCQLLSSLTRLMERNRCQLESADITQILQRISYLSSNAKEVRVFLKAIVESYQDFQEWTPKQISICLHGLSGLSSDHYETRQLVALLAAKIDQLPSTSHEFDISRAFFGLQGLSSKHIEVRSLMMALHKKLDYRRSTLDNIGSALYGLQNMSLDHKEIRTVFETLITSTLRRSSTTAFVLTPRQIGQCMVGMKEMTSVNTFVRVLLGIVGHQLDTYAVVPTSVLAQIMLGVKCFDSLFIENKKILIKLSTLLRAPGDNFTLIAVRCALIGLQNLNSDNDETLEYIQALLYRLESSSVPFDADCMYFGLFGCQNLSVTYPEVRTYLRWLSAKSEAWLNEDNPAGSVSEIKWCHMMMGLRRLSSTHIETWGIIDILLRCQINVHSDALIEKASIVEIARAMNSLQGISASRPQVLTLLNKLTAMLERCEEPMGSAEIGIALFGLKSLAGNSDQIRRLLAILTERIQKSESIEPNAFAQALLGLQNMDCTMIETASILAALHDRVLVSSTPFDHSSLGDTIFALDALGRQHDIVNRIHEMLAMKVRPRNVFSRR